MKIQNESAVSSVVGVMLMIVVVIIVAAVVSGFAGGLVGGNNQKAPQLTMDARLANGGYWSNSYLMMTVTGVDAPIPTKDLKIVTSWSKVLPNGTTMTGGNTVVPGQYNYNIYYWVYQSAMYDNWKLVAPMGYGPGVFNANGSNVMSMFWPFNTLNISQCTGSVSGKSYCQFSDINGVALGNSSWFGNYPLVPGTIMFARPFGPAYGGSKDGSGGYDLGYGAKANGYGSTSYGGGKYYYAYGSSYIPHPNTIAPPNTLASVPTAIFYESVGLNTDQSEDMMMGILGSNWNFLRPGDTVNIKVVHTPTGKTIFNKDVLVEG